MTRMFNSVLAGFVFMFSFAFILLNARSCEAYEVVATDSVGTTVITIRKDSQLVNNEDIKLEDVAVTQFTFVDMTSGKAYDVDVTKYLGRDGKPIHGVVDVDIHRYFDENLGVKKVEIYFTPSITSSVRNSTDGVFINTIRFNKVVNGEMMHNETRIVRFESRIANQFTGHQGPVHWELGTSQSLIPSFAHHIL